MFRLLVLLVGLPLGCASAPIATQPLTSHSPWPTTSAAQGHAPARLEIPAIHVAAKVEAVGLDADHNIATPSGTQTVAWYKDGAAPGNRGNVTLNGHFDWTTVHCPRQGSEPPEAVFCHLSQLQFGDKIYVTGQDGAMVRYKVLESQTFAWNAKLPGLFDQTGPSRLSLVTCAGAWDTGRSTYSKRLIVTALPE